MMPRAQHSKLYDKVNSILCQFKSKTYNIHNIYIYWIYKIYYLNAVNRCECETEDRIGGHFQSLSRRFDSQTRNENPYPSTVTKLKRIRPNFTILKQEVKIIVFKEILYSSRYYLCLTHIWRGQLLGALKNYFTLLL